MPSEQHSCFLDKNVLSFQRSSRKFAEGPPGPQKKSRSISNTAEQVCWSQLRLCVLGHGSCLFPGLALPCSVSTPVTAVFVLAG